MLREGAREFARVGLGVRFQEQGAGERVEYLARGVQITALFEP